MLPKEDCCGWDEANKPADEEAPKRDGWDWDDPKRPPDELLPRLNPALDAPNTMLSKTGSQRDRNSSLRGISL